MPIEDFLTKEAKLALGAVRKIIDPLWEPSKDEDWRPPTADRRLTWALSKKSEGFVISILAEQEDSWATRQAKYLEKQFPETVVWTTSGEAQSSYPETNWAPHATCREIRPGVSIGHGRYRAGTLGCIVVVPGEDRDQVGVVAAAHVVALSTTTVERGNRIYSPGKPEIGNAITARDAIGRLDNYVELIPVVDYQPGEDIFQSIDIAFVKLEGTERKTPKFNEVPNPDDPANRSIRLKRIVLEKELPDYLNDEIYQFGRTSGFSSGKLVYHHIAQRQIKLPNKKIYLYNELFGVVTAADSQRFSRPGDSGAPVYTRDGGLLGFVVGADDGVSLCCMAERSLAAMNAKLLGAQGG